MVRCKAEVSDFYLLDRVQIPATTQLPVRWVLGASWTGLERSGREAEHLPSASAEMKNASTSPVVLIR